MFREADAEGNFSVVFSPSSFFSLETHAIFWVLLYCTPSSLTYSVKPSCSACVQINRLMLTNRLTFLLLSTVQEEASQPTSAALPVAIPAQDKPETRPLDGNNLMLMVCLRVHVHIESTETTCNVYLKLSLHVHVPVYIE